MTDVRSISLSIYQRAKYMVDDGSNEVGNLWAFDIVVLSDPVDSSHLAAYEFCNVTRHVNHPNFWIFFRANHIPYSQQ